jgi:hypothetical protein
LIKIRLKLIEASLSFVIIIVKINIPESGAQIANQVCNEPVNKKINFSYMVELYRNKTALDKTSP